MKVLLLMMTLLLPAMYVNAAEDHPKNFTITLEYWPPFSYLKTAKMTKSDKGYGLDIDVVHAVFNKLYPDMKITYLQRPWKRCLHLVKVGKAHSIIPLYQTKEREAFLHYPKEHTSMDVNVLVSNKAVGQAFSGNLNDIKGQTVLQALGNSYGDIFDKNKAVIKKNVPALPNIVKMISKNRAPYGIVSKLVYLDYVKDKSIKNSIIIQKNPVSSHPLFLGFSKKAHPNMANIAKYFSQALINFKKTAEYKTILGKYGITDN